MEAQVIVEEKPFAGAGGEVSRTGLVAEEVYRRRLQGHFDLRASNEPVQVSVRGAMTLSGRTAAVAEEELDGFIRDHHVRGRLDEGAEEMPGLGGGLTVPESRSRPVVAAAGHEVS